MNISVNVEIESSKQKVWEAITDIPNCAKMISGIIDLNIIHQPEQGLVGLKWSETRKMFGKEATETMWITESELETFYCTRAESHGTVYITRMEILEIDGKTLLTMTFSDAPESILVKCISSIMVFFMKNSMTKMLQADLNDIKDFVENK